MRKGLSQAGEHSAARAMALPVLLWSVLVCSAGDQLPTARQDHDSESFRLSVDVALVILHASVTDRGGSFVHNLGEQDFDVYEDGVRQHIRLFEHEDIPVTVGLVVDHSSTMGRKLAEVAAAARTFVRSSNREDEMFVVNFNEKVSLGLPRPIRFTNNATELENAITSAPTGGETALYDAIATALGELRAGNRDRRVLIVVSDGGDNASTRSLAQVTRLAGQSDAVIYTVGIFGEEDPDRNPAALKSLALATGGVAFLPKQVSEVVAVCERIARDVRHQYTIGYVPGNPSPDGTYRTIRVLATGKGHDKLSVRTRTGYIAAGERRIDKRGAK